MVDKSSSLDICELRGMVDRERVEAVRALMPPDNEVSELSDIFGLLADPGRLRLLNSLLELGEMCVCDLAAVTGLNESSVSDALRLLRAHRVMQVRRAGRMSYYGLADAHVCLLLDLGLQHIGHTFYKHPQEYARL